MKTALSKRSPRALTVVTLLAVAPVALFAVGQSILAVVAVVNVGLIFGSLYLLTSPAEGEGHESESHAEDDHAESAV